MKELNTFQLVKVPEGIEASVKSRIVTVKGSRGTLNKDFKHLAVDIYMPDSKTIKVRAVLRIRDVYLGSEFSEPDPYLRTRIRIRLLSSVTHRMQKKLFCFFTFFLTIFFACLLFIVFN